MNNKEMSNIVINENAINNNPIETLVNNHKIIDIIDVYISVAKALCGSDNIIKESNKYKFVVDTADSGVYVGVPSTIYSFFEHLINVDISIEDEFASLSLTDYGLNMLQIKRVVFLELINEAILESCISSQEFDNICTNKEILIYN